MSARMSSSAVKASKYSYRSTGGGQADVSIEYSADLSALSRLEVRLIQPYFLLRDQISRLFP